MEETEDTIDAAEPVELVECVNRNRVPRQCDGTTMEAYSAQDFPWIFRSASWLCPQWGTGVCYEKPVCATCHLKRSTGEARKGKLVLLQGTCLGLRAENGEEFLLQGA